MSFERFFMVISYAAVLCGFASLWISGTFGPIGTGLFVIAFTVAALIEGSRWQISERLGTALIVLALPFYYAAYEFSLISFNGTEAMISGMLSRLVITLTVLKLIQKKADRDWVFLYLMAFFEVLLGAGLSISLPYLAILVVYVAVAVLAVITFEIERTRRRAAGEMCLADPDHRKIADLKRGLSIRSLPIAAILLIVAITALAVPLFFVLPRVGGAGLGSRQSTVSTMTGFSDRMQLGAIGRIQQNDAVVMRVRISGKQVRPVELYFRGVALDTFDNRTWSSSGRGGRQILQPVDGVFNLSRTSTPTDVIKQEIFLEPLDTPVLFAVPKATTLKSSFPMLYRDPTGDLSYLPNGERISYEVFSDTTVPSAAALRGDNEGYDHSFENYLQLPEEFDHRVAELAHDVTQDARSRYDKARAIEQYLKTNYGYTLEMKNGGPEPLSDFLFNNRVGHCEYFASSMVMMLRSQGIASRVVTGFHTGEYNPTAGLYIVRQKYAHAWVEAYFPGAGSWVTFDPTPPSYDQAAAGGILAEIGKYIEALDAIWIQYFVAYDDQGQSSVTRSITGSLEHYSAELGSLSVSLRSIMHEWFEDLRGENGLITSVRAVVVGFAVIIGAVVLILGVVRGRRRIVKSILWQKLKHRFGRRSEASVVIFYERMIRSLEKQGKVRLPQQTPLEFAYSVGMPGAVFVTERYNEVRFGRKALSESQIAEIEASLEALEQ
ncbi:MAG: DUF3488 domain-containing protein [Acidobacteria bacterium]|nr:DUF3488 domain-containing protein [Acidobacteriota bacterium]